MIKVIIIGGMAAGCKAAARLIRLSSDYQITIIERKPVISFGICGLPFYASGEIDNIDDLAKTAYGTVRDAEYFREVKGIDVLTKTEAELIDTGKNQVVCRDLTNKDSFELQYDKLIIATGSKAIEPTFPYPKSERISSFHSPLDAKKFRETAQKGQVGKAVIIGGGFIGCELTEALSTLWGIETILIEKEKSLLSNFLDPDISELVENRIEKNDVQILSSTIVDKIELNEQELPIAYLYDGRKIECDYVFYNLGVQPETTIAKNAGIKIGEFGGIIVDEKMRTSIPNIWAAGDCVEIKNLVTNKQDYFALGSLSNRMGRISADSIAGNDVAFKGAAGAVSLKIFGLITSATGITENKAKEFGYNVGSVIGCWSDRPDYYPGAKNLFGKLVFEKQSLKLLGVQLAGEGNVNRYVDVFSELLSNNKTVYDLLDVEHGYTPPHSSPISPLNYFGHMVINQEIDGVNNFNYSRLFSFDGIYIDVREESEIESSPFMSKVLNIPMSKFRSKLSELDPEQPKLILCEKGPRAYEAARLLVNMGHKNISYLGGGMIFLNEVSKNTFTV
jgi:NADPH-dependent 2,4-dienoyl-CoA reductase/sulfur reductase-like enzyme/rhodanese-related sulfurtransferase